MATIPSQRRRRSSHAPLVLALLLAACGQDTSSDPSAGQGQLVCDAKRAAVAYRGKVGASSGEATSAPGAPLTPCFQLTGLASSETSLAVQKDGTLIVAPVITAEGTGVLRSRDKAKTWETLLPGHRGGSAHQRVQPYMYMDPLTERLLFVTTAGAQGSGFALSISDDAGDTWTAGRVGQGTVDWIKLASGPAVTSAPVGYPNVLYASAPAPISTGFPDYQQVERSLDGGKTWQRVGGEMLSLQPAQNDCPASEWVIYGAGLVAKDGSLYLGFRRCTRLGIAVSRDEGATFTVRDLPGASLVPYGGIFSHYDLFNLMVAEPLATDSDGNLYAIWNEKEVLRMSVSRDRAETWSTPIAVAQPQVTHTVFADLDVKAPGTVAIAYYGSEDQGRTYNAYASESLDALAVEPTFRGVRLNSPTEPPLFADGFDLGYADVLTGGDLLEIIQVKYAPDGDIWTSFGVDMCPGQTRSACTWDLTAHVDAPYQLAIGRLTHGK